MTTPLRDLYDELKRASTAEQHRTCEGLLAELERPGAAPCLAARFADSLAGNATFDNFGQPFLNGASLTDRKPLGPDAPGDNRLVHLFASRVIGPTRRAEVSKEIVLHW